MVHSGCAFCRVALLQSEKRGLVEAWKVKGMPEKNPKKRSGKSSNHSRPAKNKPKKSSKAPYELTPLDVKYVLSDDRQTLTLDREYVKVDEEDPAIVIHWYEDTLGGLLGALAAAPPPVGHYLRPIALNANSTVDDLKTALVARVAVAAGGVLCSSIIAPNTTTQYKNVHSMLGQLGNDPVMQAINIPSLGDLYRIDDGKRPTIGILDPSPPALFGRVQLFN
jgi:hypothetical protein